MTFLQPIMRKRKHLKISNLEKENWLVQTAHFPLSTILILSSPPPFLLIIREPKHKSIRKSPLSRKAEAEAWRSSVTEHKCTENGSSDYLFYTLFTAIVQALSSAVRKDDLTHAGRSIIKSKSYQLSENQIKVRNNKNTSIFSSVLSITSFIVQWILPPTCITAGDWTVEVTAFVVWDNVFKGVGTAFFINWVPEFLKKSNNSNHTHAENSCQTSQWQNRPWS